MSNPPKLLTDIMATEMEHFKKLPKELRDDVWQKALIVGPGAHFIKANSDYNGTLLKPAAENALYVYGPGIAKVSSFSASFEHARMSMVSQEGKEAVERMRRKREMTRILLNPGMTSATANPDAYTNLPIDTSQWASILVDKINDIFVFSSFGSIHFPNDHFSGGIACSHADVQDIKILGISMPQCNRGADDFLCRDCGKDFADDGGPDRFLDGVEFCKSCLASWTSELPDVELVYLIVPGIRRAQVGEKVAVSRFGEGDAMNTAYCANRTVPSGFHPPKLLPAYGTRPAMTISGVQTAEPLGPEGARCFHGSGITLFEVPDEEIQPAAFEIMAFIFKANIIMRRSIAMIDDEFWPLPRNPSHCHGAIEFRFLSF